MATPQTLRILKTELDTDPLVRGYAGMTHLQAANDLNAKSRSGQAGVDQLRTYFLLERRARMFLYGRLEVVANSAIGTDPLAEAVPLTLEHVISAKTMLNILNPTSGFSLDLSDTRFDALLNDLSGGAGGCKVIGPSDKTAIQAFSTNVRSRGEELGIGRVEEGEVQFVRGGA